MNSQEFSTEFDVLYNNVTSNQAPGLNEYEKSVFLTKAQSQLVNEYFNQRTDGFGGGFDGSQKRQYDFSSITKVENLFDINSYDERVTSTEKLDRRSRVFLFPQNYFLAVNEILSDENWQYSVLPISHSEYQRLMLKPYNFPVKRGAWRIITNKKTCNFVHEDAKGNNLKDIPSLPNDYEIFTTWAGITSNTNIVIKNAGKISDTSQEAAYIVDNLIIGTIAQSEGYVATKISNSINVFVTANISTQNNNCTITFTIKTYRRPAMVEDWDDKSILSFLKETFKQVKDNDSDPLNNPASADNPIIKAIKYVDGFERANASSQLFTFRKTESNVLVGRTFKMTKVSVPTIEIIGKFTGNVNYQLRYIRNLSPIILEDLDNYGTDLTIDGVVKATECELPEETHQEILERAVTLAKIAWQGGTMTGAAQQAKNG
jgi:hypothetical protein